MNRFWSKRLPAVLLALTLLMSLTPVAGASNVTPASTHHYDSVWAHDEANHWHACIDAGCLAKGDFEPHTYGEITVIKAPTCFQPGEGSRTCIRCGYLKTETIPATNLHVAGTEWRYDKDGHWHGCTVTPGCPQKLDNTAHSCATGAYTTNSSHHWQICDVCHGEFSKAAHVDADNNGACDRCGYAMPISALSVIFRNGNDTYSTQTVAKGKTPQNPGTPSKASGYVFKGWSTSDPGSSAAYRGQSVLSSSQITNISITSNTTYYAVYTVSVSGQDVSVTLDSAGGITANSGTYNSLSLVNQMNSRFAGSTGTAIRYVRFGSTSGSSYGQLYTNIDQTALSTNTNYYYDSSAYGNYPLFNVYFLPSGEKGTFSISYAAYDEYGNSASGIASFVTGKSASSSTAISYTVQPGEKAVFERSDFNAAYQKEHSGNVRYVQFDTASTLISDNGRLYYDYGKSGEKEFTKNTIDDYVFYYSSSSYGDFSLDELSFVASDSFNTTVKLSFRAYGSGSNYVDGTVEIRSTSTTRDGTIHYTVKPGKEVGFDAADFNRAYQKEHSGNVRYVQFDTASTLISDNGRLYYDYGYSDEKEFSRNTIDDYSFYYSSSSYGDFSLDELSFVASDRFNTTVTLSFRAYGSGSNYVDGTVTISTTDSAKQDGDIAYTVSPGEEVSFNASDFNDFYQKDYSGDIRYVRFDTASTLTSDSGQLYYDYDGFDEKEFSKNTVDDYDFYYRDKTYGEFNLDKLSFVAGRDFNTTVSLTFRAYAASGKYVDGTVTIKPPAGAAAKGADIVYATTYNANVQINANDIARFLNKTYPGYALQYVELGGVPESGSLYYNYYSASKYGTASQLKLTGSNCDDQRLYFSPTSNSQYALTELTYVPSGVNYCVRIPFTAYGGGSRSVSGTILISVNVSEVAEVYGAVPRGTSVALPASAIYNAVAAASSNALASIQFLSLPDPSAGVLYAGSGTGTKANLTTKYGYSAGTDRMTQLRFVPASNFIGSVELPYIAYNAKGNAIASGRFCLGVVNSVAKYSDMPASSWCYKYITELSDAKIIGGYQNNTYRPNAAVTYGEALKLILLASGYSAQPRTGTHWASGYLTRAKADNLLSGSVNLDAPITRLTVAQIAAKAMKLSTSGLSSVEPFTDTTDNFVQALSAAGIVDGFFSNGVSTFKPGNTLTRGQISAIVWRMERARR